MEDNKIIELFNERSQKAIEELSKKYGVVLKRVAVNVLGNELDSEECVNDAYLGTWNTIPPQNPNPLLTYVCKIVRNLAIKKYHNNTAKKRNSNYDVALEELENCIPCANSVEEEYDAKELTQKIEAFLDTLDKDSRVMFVKRYWFSDSISDIANDFQISNHNASVKLSRIKDKLRNYLIKEGVNV